MGVNSIFLREGHPRKSTLSLNIKISDNDHQVNIYCDDKVFAHSIWTFRGNVQTGGINSLEITRLARTETRHDFLVCFYDENNLKSKKTDTINLRPLKIGNLGENSQL